jgi:Fe2+ or Zn2+ uptake regulation protein
MRTTNQLLIIGRTLHKLEGHFTAEEIYTKVKKGLPRISLATVYRNLQKLTELGEVKQTIISGRTLYEKAHGNHSHFFCIKCKSVEDIGIQEDTLTATLKRKGYHLETLDIIATGICRQCSKQ